MKAEQLGDTVGFGYRVGTRRRVAWYNTPYGNDTMAQSTSWQQPWHQAQPTLSDAKRSLATATLPVASRILRVGQLDAELLDVELVSLLRDPLSKALGLVNVRLPQLTLEASDSVVCSLMQSTLKSRFEPELSLFIQLTLYRLSVWSTGASYGAKLQDLKYTVPSVADDRVLCACNFL